MGYPLYRIWHIELQKSKVQGFDTLISNATGFEPHHPPVTMASLNNKNPSLSSGISSKMDSLFGKGGKLQRRGAVRAAKVMRQRSPMGPAGCSS